MTIKAPLLLSLQVGLSRTLGTAGAQDPDEQPWTTAIFKEPVEGPVRLSQQGLEGDAVADLEDHGGLDQALLGYSSEHYPAWRTELGQPFLKYGAFGENFTISRLDETSVCIGDIYAIGQARVQVALPRRPCWKLARRLRNPGVIERVHETARGGWYMRVLQEGFVERGSFVVLEERPCPEWTVTRAYRVYHEPAKDRPAARKLADCAPLAELWKEHLRAGG
ncbi:MAG TPA: MOSC domain-containing protein [Candidatus Polarisedimenticolia bacterium]